MIKDRIISEYIWNKRRRKGLVPIMGDDQIRKRGHRNYVGAKWELLGNLQFEFLVDNGLQPHHVLYDIACGSLRAGIHLIPYLNEGNYIGIEKEKLLIELGIDKELGQEMYKKKKPVFLINHSFEFEKLSKKPDFAIAHSLFTHLTLKDIINCLEKLRFVAEPGCHFYATFDEEHVTPVSDKRRGLPNPPNSHSNLTFYYSSDDINLCAEKAKWKYKYIGDFNHPSGQQMVLFYL